MEAVIQAGLFAGYLDPIKLKEGKQRCPCCERPMKAYGYELDDKIVGWAMRAMEWCYNNRSTTFDPREVFKALTGSDYKQAVSGTPSKAKDHGIVERAKRVGRWRITPRGHAFLQGRTQLPAKVWVFANRVVLRDDRLVDVDTVDPRWKFLRSHWSLDYILQPYRAQLPQTILAI